MVAARLSSQGSPRRDIVYSAVGWRFCSSASRSQVSEQPLSRYPLLQPRLKHALADSAAVVCAWVDLVAPAWVVSLVRVSALVILAVPAWASLALEELGSLVREWVSLVLEELGSLARVESGQAEASGRAEVLGPAEASGQADGQAAGGVAGAVDAGGPGGA